MSTVRDVISRVRSTNKLINANDLINDRVIAAELKSRSIVLIKRETNLRRLWNTDTIFTTLPCIEMEEVPLSKCCDYISDRTISKSKLPLPRISEGNYQYLINYITDLDSSKSIKYMPIKRYINRLKLHLHTNEVYYWIQEDFLFITNPVVKSVKVSAFFEEDVPFAILYPKDCNCNTDETPDCPSNPLDLEFKCPGYLETPTIDMTSKYLRETYLSTGDIKTEANQDTQRKQ